jgi:hypothetical protein
VEGSVFEAIDPCLRMDLQDFQVPWPLVMVPKALQVRSIEQLTGSGNIRIAIEICTIDRLL